jgi:hypothetical protein
MALLAGLSSAAAQSPGFGGRGFATYDSAMEAAWAGVRQPVPDGYVPSHERAGRGIASNNFSSESLGQMHVGETQYVDGGAALSMEGGEFVGDPMLGDCACGGAGCDSCGDACGCGVEGCGGCGIWGLMHRVFNRTQFYHGVTSFSSPVNRGGTGSFGFEGGFNLGAPLPCELYGLGWQFGVGGTLANLNGANFTHDDRRQLFLTTGFFRRVDWGLQGGLVFDYLKDDWYANADLAQVRGELSWVVTEGREFGFWFTSGTSDDIVTATLQNGTALPTTTTEHWEINNLYALFLRRTFVNNMQGRAFAGWTGSNDGLLGADLYIPFDSNWAMQSAFTYVIPREGQLDGGNEQEAWNIGLQLVYTPGCGSSCGKDYYRPLFNVANNGSMIVDRR